MGRPMRDCLHAMHRSHVLLGAVWGTLLILFSKKRKTLRNKIHHEFMIWKGGERVSLLFFWSELCALLLNNTQVTISLQALS
jgi:hypothetical protein